MVSAPLVRREAIPEGALLCVAGEASGDALLGDVLRLLRAREGSLPFVGVGGPQARAAGLISLVDPKELAAHGLSEAAGTVPAFLKALRVLKGALPRCRALLLVDFPELNGRLLRAAERMGLPSLWLAPPQAWAWRPWRARLVARADWVGCLFPFSAHWYQQRGVNARCVGHPLFERAPLPSCSDEGPVALFPGSRLSVARRHLPLLLETAAGIQRADPGRRFTLAASPWLDKDWLARTLRDHSLSLSVTADPLEALREARLTLSVLGTATLEIALAARPLITLGTLSPLSAAVARLLLRPPLSLPNLILGSGEIPELLLSRCTPPLLTAASIAELRVPASARAHAAQQLAAQLRAAGARWEPALVVAALQRLLSSPRRISSPLGGEKDRSITF